MSDTTQTLFPLGTLCATPGALAVFATSAVRAADLLRRHQSGDWGDLCADDKAANDLAVTDGDRILSAYSIGAGKLWVITEHDRSVTTILLPEEY